MLIGNGMAGMVTLEELFKLAPDKYDITVFGAEPYSNYNRILLSPVLAGERTVQEIMLNDDAWYAQHGITLCKRHQDHHHRPAAATGAFGERRVCKKSYGTLASFV